MSGDLFTDDMIDRINLIHRVVSDVIADCEAGKLSEVDAEEIAKQYLLKDNNGTWWSKSYETTLWYYFDVSNDIWVQDDTPSDYVISEQ